MCLYGRLVLQGEAEGLVKISYVLAIWFSPREFEYCEISMTKCESVYVNGTFFRQCPTGKGDCSGQKEFRA